MVEIKDTPVVPPQGRGFTVTHQQLVLELDFKTKILSGKTILTIIPAHKSLDSIRLSCRQSVVKSVTVNFIDASYTYQEPYNERFRIHAEAGVHQYHQLREKMAGQLREPPEGELEIEIPKVAVTELASVTPEPQKKAAHSKSEAEVGAGVVIKKEPEEAVVVAPKSRAKSTDDQGFRYQPITIEIDYSVETFRDGLHFVGWELGDERYPHVYTINSPFSGSACCLFPCVDDATSRCTWDISIKCPRTLGYAVRAIQSTSGITRLIKPPINFRLPRSAYPMQSRFIGPAAEVGGTSVPQQIMRQVFGAMYPRSRAASNGHDAPGRDPNPVVLSDADAARDMTVVCSGELTDELLDPKDYTKKVVSFACNTAIAARHIGFAIGPFAYLDLASLREVDEDEKLGQNAVQLHGYCLPGKLAELKNTCFPTAKAIDDLTLTYGSYPFSSYAVCFVDELPLDHFHAASLSICSERLLFPEDIIEPLDRVTRELVHALAYQWVGIYILPKEPSDTWITVGIAYFITDMFMKKLCGNNDYRFRQKKNVDRVCEMDVGRPSLSTLGSLLSLDPSERQFMALKSAMVLFILDRRLMKASGSTGLTRIISRVFLNAKTGELVNGCITNAQFHRTCEKLGHTKLDVFFQQWVHGTGCPRFMVTQRFNKKKLVVEMLIRQVQVEQNVTRNLDAAHFRRDIKEDIQQVKPAPVRPVFTGPMTIRIHEADGTPYEHIVEIREASTKFEIPYNTKYKRLKRSRRQKEKAAAGAAVDVAADGQDEVILYSLGDVLQSEEDIRSWRLADWTKEDEDKMHQESYEWIRMDADFEWICKMSIAMPGYMYLSQLQQDRDVVAQYESIQYIAAQNETALVSTILLRTLMDRRYFHGIRTSAAHALAKCAKVELNWIGLFHLEKAFQKFFCLDSSDTTPVNDFSDRAAYHIQCAIPQAMASIRDHHGKTPLRAKRFLYDLLRLNDNSKNKYRDWHYVCILMNALCDALIPDTEDGCLLNDDDDEVAEESKLLQSSVKEIDRHRLREEFEPSWNSICTITALNCKSRLTKAKLVFAKGTEFLQYTSSEHDDIVRIGAYGDLISVASLRRDRIVSYILHVMSNDPSPFIRENLRELFFQGLGAIAIGADVSENDVSNQDGLIIEQESSTADRQALMARKQTVAGALNALKLEVGDNDNFKKAVWKALTSKNICLAGIRDLLDLCSVLFEKKNSLIVVLKYPRYYECENLGKGQLRFTRTGGFRTRPMRRSRVETPPPSPIREFLQEIGYGSESGSESDSDSPLINRETSARRSMPPPNLPKLKLNTNTKKRANPETSTSKAQPASKKQKKSNAANFTPTTANPPTPASSAPAGPKSKKRTNAEASTIEAEPSTKKQKKTHTETTTPVAVPKAKKQTKSKAATSTSSTRAESIAPAAAPKGKKRARNDTESGDTEEPSASNSKKPKLLLKLKGSTGGA